MKFVDDNRVTTKFLILLAVLLLATPSFAGSTTWHTQDHYALGEGVELSVPEEHIGATLRVTGPDGTWRVKTQSEHTTFKPTTSGQYRLQVYNERTMLYDGSFTVSEATLIVATGTHYVGEEIELQLNTNPEHNYELTVEGPTTYEQLLGKTTFVPKKTGRYTITLTDTTARTTTEQTVNVLARKTLLLNETTYHAGGTIELNLDLEQDHVYKLELLSKEQVLTFQGLDKDITFVVPKPGNYTLQLTDYTAGLIEEMPLTIIGRVANTVAVEGQIAKISFKQFGRTVEGNLSEGMYDVAIDTETATIELNDFYVDGNQSIEFDDAINATTPNNTIDSFAINSEELPFSNGTISKSAMGEELWKCENYDFDTETCLDDWEKVRELTPGEEYEINITREETAYAEVSLSVLNVQSYPMVGGEWQVNFITRGTADLFIRTINGTTWSDLYETEDLKLIRFMCGDEHLPYEWENDTLIVRDFSCNTTAHERSRVLTPGKHHFEITFGNETAYANNYASATGILMLRNTVGGDDANTVDPGVNLTWDQQDRIDTIYSHTPGSDEVTINTDGIYRISYGFQVNRSATNNNRNEVTGRVIIDGVEEVGCVGNGYLRAQSQNIYNTVITSDCLLNLSSGQRVAVNVYRTGGNYGAELMENRNWMHMQRLDHNDVLRIYDAGGGQDTDQPEGRNMTFDTIQSQGPSFAYGADDENITIQETGLYRVTYGVQTFQNSNRNWNYARLLVNGETTPFGYGSGFSRNTDNVQDAIINSDFLIELNQGDELVLSVGRESDTAYSTTSVANKKWMHIERVQTNNDNVYIAYKNNTAESVNSQTAIEVDFDVVYRSDSFFNQIDNENVQVLQDGLYRASYSVYATKTSGNTRAMLYAHLTVNNVNETVCWSAAYNRGTTTSNGVSPNSSNFATCIVNLTAGDNVSVAMGRFSTSSSAMNSVGTRTWFSLQALDATEQQPNVTGLVADPDPVELGQNINLSANVSDNTAVDAVFIEVTLPTASASNYTAMNSGVFYYNETIPTSEVGTYTFRIYANDTNGFRNDSESITFDVQDTTIPAVTGLIADPSTVELGTRTNLTATITDLGVLDSIIVEVVEPDTTRTNYTMGLYGNQYSNLTISTSQLGVHTYLIHANDSSGNMNNTVSNTFTVSDTTNPSVDSVFADPPIIGSGQAINLSALITDNGTIDTVIIEVTEPDVTRTNLTTIQSGTTYYNETFLGAQSGTHTYRIYVNDSSGNRNDTVSSTFSVQADAKPPNVTAVTDTPDPAIIYELINISFDVKDDESTVDTGIIEITAPDGTQTNYTTYNLSSLYWNETINITQAGTHTYKIYANDSESNLNSTQGGSFFANESDNPDVTSLSATPAPVELFSLTNISFTVTDNVLIDSVILEVTSPSSNANNYTVSQLGSTYWNETINGSELGTFTYRVYANDSSSNQNASVTSTFLVQDTIPPLVQGLTDAPDPVEIYTYINISANTIENSTVDTVLIEVTQPNGTQTNYTTRDSTGTYWNETINNTLIGSHTYRIYANDTSGNLNADETGSFTVQDTEAPKITGIAANPPTIDPEDLINLSANVTDNFNVSTIIFEITDPKGGKLNYSSIKFGSTAHNDTINATIAGQHRYRVFVNDTSGNMNVSSFSTFFVNNYPPNITSYFLNATSMLTSNSDNLTAQLSTTDRNNETPFATYDWRVNGTSIALLHYDFNVNNSAGTGLTRDHTTNNFNGTVTGAAWNRTGGFDGSGAYEFDGVNDQITIDSRKLNMTENFTVMFWFRSNTDITSASSQNYHYVDKDNDFAIRHLSQDAGRIRMLSYGGNIQSGLDTFDAGVWYHYAAVITTAGSATMYINGVENASGSIGAVSDDANVTYFGIDSDQGDDLNGAMDDIRIYGRILSLDQIRAIYRNETDILLSDETSVSDTWSACVSVDDSYENLSQCSNNITILDQWPPQIVAVESATTYTPIIGTNVTAQINITVIDLEGASDLNDSSIVLNASRNVTVRSSVCSQSDINTTARQYFCNVSLTPYDPAGLWTVNISISDDSRNQTFNTTAPFTYNVLDAIALSAPSLNFGSFSPGLTDQAATENPLVIDNLGNSHVDNITLTGYNFAGPTTLLVSNATINTTDNVGLPMSLSAQTIENSTVPVDTDSLERNKSFYFYISVPASFPAGTYSATSNWEVVSNG